MGDLRNALRALRATPVVTTVTVLSLALGIGANTAIFSLVNDLLLRTLPVRDPQQLVMLDKGSWTNPIWEQIRDRQRECFNSAMAWSSTRFDLARGGAAEFVEGILASGGFFEVLGVPAILGRTFQLSDDRRGGGPDGPVAVISYSFWQRHFGGAPDAIGRTIALNRVTFAIIGVTPPGFFGPQTGRAFDVAIPIGAEPLLHGKESWLDRRSTWWLSIMARLKAGQSMKDAENRLRAIQPQIREATLPTDWRSEDLKSYLREGFELIAAAGGSSSLRRRYGTPLMTMMVIVALVLIIACANIANLFLARAAGRRHELSLRIALGASRVRLAAQLLAESLLLAAVGAALGMLVAKWGASLLVRQLSTERNTIFLDLAADWRVLLFTTALAVSTALLFGTAPAIRAARVEPIEALKSHGRGFAGEGRRVVSNPLVVVQVAFSLVLIVAGGLFLRTFSGLSNLRLGFDRDPVMIVRMDAQKCAVEPSRRPSLFQRVRDSVAVLPGVSHAAVSVVTPVSGSTWNNLLEFPDGTPLSERERIANMNLLSPDWFATYGTSMLAGRDFDTHDLPGSTPVVIINKAFAKKYFGGANPIGRTFRNVGRPGKQTPLWEIVGLVEDSVYRSLREPLSPTFYLPFAQWVDEYMPGDASLSVRAAGGRPELLVKTVTEAITSVDKDLSLTFMPLSDQIDSSLVQERLVAMLAGFFGTLALLLAGIGLYGVTAYSVGRRRREIGIRIALGAVPASVVRMVVGRVALLVGLGIVLGAAVSTWASQFVEKLLFGLKPRDPLTLVGAAAVLAAIGAVAGWLPAHRATRIEPAEVLREE
jgi:putative ABC transport system permease protein